MSVTVSELWTYPVKSCQGVRRDEVTIDVPGIAGDRAFAIWSDEHLVEQKETPAVAAIGAGFDEASGVLRLTHRDHGEYLHAVRATGTERRTVWLYEKFGSVDQGDEVAAWLSTALGRDVRLVGVGSSWKINLPVEQLAPLHGLPKQSFTAAAPVGLASQRSLDDLNGRLDAPIPMDRFRVNVVIDGLDAFAEDGVVSFSNGEVELHNVTAAERCVIITTDQQTGERPPNKVLPTLRRYRQKPKEERFASGLAFGCYLSVTSPGTLRVGDELTLSRSSD